uniref:Transposase n=1 Tax=Heterorhabditis bacteriophora TaxID=37862 RepID=A0A1I7XII3_HETBA
MEKRSVIRKLGQKWYEVRIERGVWKRHINQLKNCWVKDKEQETVLRLPKNIKIPETKKKEQQPTKILRRSVRTKKPVKRYVEIDTGRLSQKKRVRFEESIKQVHMNNGEHNIKIKKYQRTYDNE